VEEWKRRWYPYPITTANYMVPGRPINKMDKIKRKEKRKEERGKARKGDEERERG
jgi:hypothetical protein